jgi:hypothetical protein
MSNQESWIENAEKYALFLNEGDSGEAGKLLEISPSNRTIAGRKQAVILATLRFAGKYYRSLYPDKPKSYEWIDDLCDNIEEYQLTLDGEQNSRRQFIKTVIGKAINMFKGNNKNNQEVMTK